VTVCTIVARSVFRVFIVPVVLVDPVMLWTFGAFIVVIGPLNIAFVKVSVTMNGSETG
jgi:hypothetical protein